MFERWRADFPDLVTKMEAQHAEARETAEHAESVLGSGAAPAQLVRAIRQFHAIAQHNIIEEERDLFRLAAPRG